jgi:hypothetical protein
MHRNLRESTHKYSQYCAMCNLLSVSGQIKQLINGIAIAGTVADTITLWLPVLHLCCACAADAAAAAVAADAAAAPAATAVSAEAAEAAAVAV